MLNVVTIVGQLMEQDSTFKEIRYLKVEKVYSHPYQDHFYDIIPITSWDRKKYGEVFSFKEGSLVLIKGRVENYQDKVVIICETISYLMKKE